MMTWLDEFCRNIVPTLLTCIKPFIITFLSTQAIGGIAEGYVLNKKYNHNLKTAKLVTARPLIKDFNQSQNSKLENHPTFKEIPPESVTIPSEIKQNIMGNQLSKTIKEFVTTIEEKNNNLNLFFMYDNLRSLKLSKIHDFLFTNISGLYFIDKNEIKLMTSSKKTFFHELFHMASSFKRNNIYYCGFMQHNGHTGSIGSGINEGYTNLLVEHYFGLKIRSYKNEVMIARQIENIIGREKMEQLYFQANLQGLIGELCKYSSLDEVLKLIQTVDYINYITLNHNLGVIPIKKIYLDKSMTLVQEIIDNISKIKNQNNLKFEKK